MSYILSLNSGQSVLHVSDIPSLVNTVVRWVQRAIASVLLPRGFLSFFLIKKR